MMADRALALFDTLPDTPERAQQVESYLPHYLSQIWHTFITIPVTLFRHTVGTVDE